MVVGARAGTGARVGRIQKQKRKEMALAELQRRLAIEQEKAIGRAGAMGALIREILTASPEAMKHLEPFIPRAP